MAEKLDNYQFSRHPHASKYPWDEWLDGSVWKLTKGEDFDVEPDSMTVTIYTTAKKRGHKVRTSKGPDFVVLQAYQPDDSQP